MRAGEMVLYDSSTLPREEKSQLRKWFEGSLGLNSSPLSMSRAKKHVVGGLTAFRQGSEGLLTGAVLGAINAESPTGLDIGGVPLDGALGALLTAASVFGADSELAPDARNIGTSSLAIWSFRQTTNLLAEKRLASGRALPAHLTPEGMAKRGHVAANSNAGSEDPILRASKAL